MAVILNQNTSDTNARLVQVVGQPQDAALKITQEWPWQAGRVGSGSSAQELMVALNATTNLRKPYTNVDTYAGKFIVSDVKVKDENEEGTNDRKCTIIRTLSKVKEPTTVAGLGTPDKGADQITLNYLGFQEGKQRHIYHKYRNIDPAKRTTVMALNPSDTGYTIVKKTWEIESDKTGTYTVVFENDTWPRTGTLDWNTNKVKVGYLNYDARSNTGGGKTGGAGIQEVQQLTGLSDTDYTPELVHALRADTHRVVQKIVLREKDDGEYEIEQTAQISFASTSDTAAEVIGIEAPFGDPLNEGIQRIWPRRTLAAKVALADTSAGEARTNYTHQSIGYVHEKCQVNDNRDGTFDVIQTLRRQDTGIEVYNNMTVRTVTNVASMGPCDREADEQTLNFLGFQEGTQKHHYRRYRNLLATGANRNTAMALTPPTDTGYTCIGKQWKVERDNTASMYYIYEKNTWPSSGDLSWTSNKVKVAYINYDSRSNTGAGNQGGAGIEEEQQLTGLSETGYVPELVLARKGDTHRVVTRVQISERTNGEYVINQRQAISFASTSDTACTITLKGTSFKGTKPLRMQRVWPRRTYAAKETLIAGSAVGDTKYGGDTYWHDNVQIVDNRDGTYDVIQNLGSQTGGSVGAYDNMYFNDSIVILKLYTRSKDNKVKRRRSVRMIRAFATERAGWSWIDDQNANNYFVVAGTERVTKHDHFFYVADAIKTKKDARHCGDWSDT